MIFIIKKMLNQEYLVEMAETASYMLHILQALVKICSRFV